MINLKTCTEKELWQYIAVHLKKNGIDTILVGGAVVSIYSNGAYHSGDLDFVKTSMFVTKLEETMNELGFKKHGRHYVHPECKHLFVEFPGGPPLGIGEDNTIVPDEVEVDGVTIKIFSATDCVKDRLASYIYFKASEGLDQAVLVAKNQEVNLASIKKWCKGENSLDTFEEFIEALKKN
jgi:ABC-type transport system substrate-binding protein